MPNRVNIGVGVVKGSSRRAPPDYRRAHVGFMTLLDILPSLGHAAPPRFDPATWPITAHPDEEGRLCVGGVALADIADEFDTPAYVIAGLVGVLVIAGIIMFIMRRRKRTSATRIESANEPMSVGPREQRRTD